MTNLNPYSVHPRLARFAAGWDRYAEIAGNEDAELWRGYCEYLNDFDEWDGEPLRFDDWLAEHQHYAEAWDWSTGQVCLAQDTLRQSCGDDPDVELRSAYTAYRAIVAEPLPYDAWLGALARAARTVDAPCAAIQAHQCCTPLRPLVRYLK